eukprot:SAG31_NODE_631_length_13367_cov_6.190648_7_plen_63_part_00
MRLERAHLHCSRYVGKGRRQNLKREKADEGGLAVRRTDKETSLNPSSSETSKSLILKFLAIC